VSLEYVCGIYGSHIFIPKTYSKNNSQIYHNNRQEPTLTSDNNSTYTPKLNGLIKTHEEGKPIRPVINNIQASSYKHVKHLNEKLDQLINLRYTRATKNSEGVAQELINFQINDQHKIITLDIKDLCVNLTIQNVIRITKFWLSKNNNPTIVIKQASEFIRMILNQNYFQ